MAKEMTRRSNEGRAERLPHRWPSELFSPWFDSFLRPLDGWFDDFFTMRPILETARTAFIRPDLGVDETDNEFVITADLPGVSKNDVNIETRGNQIMISAERHWDKKSATTDEEGKQTYRRILTLPTGVEVDKISADYADGVLTMKIPKGEAMVSRRIQIGEKSGTRVSGSTEKH